MTSLLLSVNSALSTPPSMVIVAILHRITKMWLLVSLSLCFSSSSFQLNINRQATKTIEERKKMKLFKFLFTFSVNHIQYIESVFYFSRCACFALCNVYSLLWNKSKDTWRTTKGKCDKQETFHACMDFVYDRTRVNCCK
jgi:hypothetical protein